MVEDGEGVAHSAIGLFCYQGECFRLCRVSFLLSDIHQMVDGVLSCHSLEVIDLTAAQDGWKYLVFLGCCQDGGSSSVLRKALKAAAESICTSSMINTL